MRPRPFLLSSACLAGAASSGSDTAAVVLGDDDGGRAGACRAAIRPVAAELGGVGGGRAVFTTSLGIEDQVITATIGTDRLAIDVVTLETGRLFKETVDLIDETEGQYGIAITRYVPA